MAKGSKPYTIFIYLFVYKIVMDLTYRYAIHGFYAYMGFAFEFDLLKLIFAYFVFLLLLPQIARKGRSKRPSMQLLYFVDLIYFIPGLSLIEFAGFSWQFIAFYVLYWVTMQAGTFIDTGIIPSLKPKKTYAWVYAAVMVIFVVLALFITGSYNNFTIKFDLSDVYALRSDAREANMPTILAYLQNAITIMIPLTILLFLERKKYLFAAGLTLLQLMLYAFGANKTYFFYIAIAYILAFVNETTARRMAVPGLIIINAISFLSAALFRVNSFVGSTIIRRILFLPSYISNIYYKFFLNEEKDYLRQSLLRWFGASSPYKEKIARLIGNFQRGSTGANVNTGLVGDGFANFGWGALLVYPFLFFVLFAIYDYCVAGIPPKFKMFLAIVLAITITNASFFTMLLTNGFLLVCILMLFFPETSPQPDDKLRQMYKKNRKALHIR